ncbi:MAG TPA: hypothetical protein DDY49_01920 [Paenibacillaceae bacterium]|nr:hypothetical protein [Paenibacillaceae bacterium]
MIITIGVIGAGRLGTSFALFMHNKGYNVTGMYSRTYDSAHKSATLIGEFCKAYEDLSTIIRDCNWIVITTRDDAISQVVRQIIDQKINLTNKIVFHMSGASTSLILEPLCSLGAEIASLHPLQTFADPVQGALALEKAYFSLEGSSVAVEIIKNELLQLKLHHFIITAEQKPLYHAAASMASNSLVAVIDYSLSLLEQAGINREQGVEALFPLMETSLFNCKGKSPAKALTGPIVRGDVETVALHVDKIKKEAPSLLPFYYHLSQLTLETAVKEQLTDVHIINKLKELLNPE